MELKGNKEMNDEEKKKIKKEKVKSCLENKN